MPTINSQTKEMQNGDVVLSYINTVGPQSETFTFATAQETVVLKNKGSKDITYTLGGQSGTLSRSQQVKVTGSITDIMLSSQAGTQQFEVWAEEAGTKGVSDGAISTLDGKVTDLTTQLAQLATQVGEGGGGGGTLTVETLSSLQSLYPNGLTVPVWVTEENKWYYWNGATTPTDTTAPVLTITPAATFTDTQTVTMSTNETATIYYTLDDSDPKTSGTKLTYSNPLTLTATDTIKAYAEDTVGNESAVQTVTYTKQAVASYKNVFDKNTMVTTGYFVNTTGTGLTASGTTAYAKIPVKPSTVYSIQPKATTLDTFARQGSARGKLAFSTDGTAFDLGAIDMSTETTRNGTADSNSHWFYFTTPANCNYILMSTALSNGGDWKDTMQVEEGNTIHNYYLAYSA